MINVMTTDTNSTLATIRLLQLDWDEAQVLAKPIRTSVFIEEQGVPEADEWDDEDGSSLHIVVTKNGHAVATARLTKKGKIGRMAVLKAHRQQGIGSMMLTELIQAAKQADLQSIKLWAQIHAQGFYKKQGFIAYGDVFLDAGIPHPHIEMRLSISNEVGLQ